MPNLIIGAISPRVLKDTWQQEPSIYQGERMRLGAGNLFDGSFAEARVWSCQIYCTEGAEEAALRAAWPRGVGQAMEGDLPGELVPEVVVDIGTSAYRKRRLARGDPWGLHRVVTLHIEEVEPRT